MEFLVQVDISIPDSIDHGELDNLVAAERARAAELAAAGNLVRIWRVPGRWANWGLWRVPSRAALEEVYASLPLCKYMTIKVHPLDRHPSDPGPSATAEGE